MQQFLHSKYVIFVVGLNIMIIFIAHMNKANLVDSVANKVSIAKKDCVKIVDIVFQSITEGLKKDGEVVYIGFGRFKVDSRAARDGRNPKTGDVIKIPASKAIKFRPGKSLKDHVNGNDEHKEVKVKQIKTPKQHNPSSKK